jgi:cell division septation protein DedD
MLSIVNGQSQTGETPIPDAPAGPSTPETPAEFEIVLGKRQVAGVLFVATVVVVVFSAVSYLAGKALAPVSKKETEAAAIEPVPTPVPAVTVSETPLAPVINPTKPAEVKSSAAPLFAEPKAGAVYLQMGAVEKGMAAIFAEGLRTHGLDAFVAPGPNERIFRVLIGPLPDPKSYERAKFILDQIGLTTFARKYDQ